ncbi:MAG: hypothetical protein O8C64_09715 [Candidatus Methanoperedens sp.]|nr:hypothetical protein [Candidatus Methanoperedens sp.]MCZ7403384.1 hypothetical protein [Candidatus Methanoperedens sp.]
MPLIKIKDNIIPVISQAIEEKDLTKTLNSDKIDKDTILVRIGPIYFQATKDLEPIGGPLFTVEPIELTFNKSLFHKTKDNENTFLRRVLLFFKGLCDVLCPYSLPIDCSMEGSLEKSQFRISFGSREMKKKWPFIPTKDLWEDFEKELIELPIKLKKDRRLLLSLMWLGHRLESKSDIQSFLDSYRIIENLSSREIEFMLTDVNHFVKNDSKWGIYCQGSRPLELDFKEGNFVKNFSISRWNIEETQWGLIKGLRDAIVHGETPDVEFREDFREALAILDSLARVILTNELKPMFNTNILICGKEIIVTETSDGKFILKPLHECYKTNPESIADYRLEDLSKEKFERLISNSNLNINEIENFKIYYKYRSHEILAKDVPETINLEDGFTMQNHDYGGVITLRGTRV